MAHTLPHDTNTNNEHGSVSSYAVGFFLSLILTFIPYYLVTRQVLEGRTLVLTILGLAIAQMFVQLFFFLHLGRGPKPLYNVIFFMASAGMIVLVVGASLLIMDNLYRNMSPQEVTMRLAQDENIAAVGGQPTGACQGNKANHIITLDAGKASPQHIDAKRCDTLTFKSKDGLDYQLKFGTPDAPVSYGGLDEVSVRNDRSKIITLNEVGHFSFHDGSDRGMMGHFVVESHED